MKLRSTEFIKSGTKPDHYPAPDMPEVAFAGRSNVGKSSLLNTLMERKRLVKVSVTPGRTQLLSWFRVNNQLLFCDLPGYGFAKVPESVKASWAPMVNRYLFGRHNLRAVAILVDVRRGFEEDDLQLYEAAAKLGRHAILVCTKIDKLTRNELTTRKRDIGRAIGVDPETDIVWFSSETGAGKVELWRRITEICGIEPSTGT